MKLPFTLSVFLVFTFAACFCFGQAEEEKLSVFNEQLTVTAYYPTPYGVYKQIRLFPGTAPRECTALNEGAFYYSSQEDRLKLCKEIEPDVFKWVNLGGSGGESIMYLRGIPAKLPEWRDIVIPDWPPPPCPAEDGWVQIDPPPIEGALPEDQPYRTILVPGHFAPFWSVEYGPHPTEIYEQFVRVCINPEKSCRVIYFFSTNSTRLTFCPCFNSGWHEECTDDNGDGDTEDPGECQNVWACGDGTWKDADSFAPAIQYPDTCYDPETWEPYPCTREVARRGSRIDYLSWGQPEETTWMRACYRCD